jgi:membrane associated rhomboid family serine protease
MAAESPSPESPIWDRPDVFPKAPDGFGWADAKNHRTPCDSIASLADAIRNDPSGTIEFVWTPEHPHLVVPETVDALSDAVLEARTRWTRKDLLESSAKLRWFTILLSGWSLYLVWNALQHITKIADKSGVSLPLSDRLRPAISHTLGSTSLGIALLLFLIFGLIPWYSARKRVLALKNWNQGGRLALIPILRFEVWLESQRAPITRAILVLITLVGLAQIPHGEASVLSAGLVKPAYFQGEWWRLLTAPFLHGNLIHFLMNAAALAYLGKRVEALARWPHVALVFLFAACVGGEASARLLATNSVGASGGLMGWLGFLLVFETLHTRLVPRTARRRLIAGILTTALIGLLGYQFIDNAAHAGGLLAGMAYAAIVFPKSASPARPKTNLTDRIAGSLALAVLAASAILAIWKISSR